MVECGQVASKEADQQYRVGALPLAILLRNHCNDNTCKYYFLPHSVSPVANLSTILSTLASFSFWRLWNREGEKVCYQTLWQLSDQFFCRCLMKFIARFLTTSGQVSLDSLIEYVEKLEAFRYINFTEHLKESTHRIWAVNCKCYDTLSV